MARTSEGRPDQAESRSSESEMDEAWRMRLNLLMREMREVWASASLGVALGWTGGWEIRWREFAGSIQTVVSLWRGMCEQGPCLAKCLCTVVSRSCPRFSLPQDSLLALSALRCLSCSLAGGSMLALLPTLRTTHSSYRPRDR